MCECIKQTTEKLQQRLAETTRDVYEWKDEGGFQHLSYPLNGGPMVILMPFVAVYTRRKIKGLPENRERKISVDIAPSYCPFCGEKINYNANV